ncbi:MAG: 5-formyltetrahydrofolate cyclo-ligase [Anaerolineae bacterium]|jgi:5-formyltetrahydrofolate cyclo-ligase
MEKSALRTRYLDLREALSPEEVATASAEVCWQLIDRPILREAKTVLTYLAFRNEIDLSLLFARLPHIRWIIPRIEGRRLVLHPYDVAHLSRHRFGMLEPTPDLPQVDPAALDVVLTPGVAFDRQGGRLGFGGGYYDRLLLTTTALRVGVSYDQCLIDGVPCREHDQRMDWVVTPSELIRCILP